MEPTTSVTTASILDIVFAAPIVVQFVMALLVFLSFWSWSLIVSKSVLVWRANQSAQAFEDTFWRSQYLSELYESEEGFTKGPLFRVFAAGMREWRNASQASIERTTLSSVQRIDRIMQTEISRQMDVLERQMIILASIGTAAPVYRSIWNCLGGDECLSGDCCGGEQHACRGCSRDRRGAAGDSSGIGRGHTRLHRLQQILH